MRQSVVIPVAVPAAGGACAGTTGAQSGGSLKPQVDSNFQGGSGTYDADPAAPAGTRRTPAANN
ncbi:MAG UNVERIFIED_CONTAM: hypothetical protein LVR18_47230 [Planctomycetaceae bacterium]